MGVRRTPWPTRMGIYVGAAVVLVFSLAPFAWVLLSSVLPEASILTFPPDWFALGLTPDNYRYIFTGQIPQSHLVTGQMRTMISQEIRQVPRGALNSFVVAGAVMVANWLLGTTAAYAYARMRFAGKRPSFLFIVFSRLVPAVALAIPYYVIIRTLDLLDTYLGLVLLHTVLTLPFTLIVLSLYFRTIPPEMDEAAQLDGCTPLQSLVRVMLPLTLPSLVGTGLFAFMLSYSEFLFALLVTSSMRSRTLPVVLASVSWNPDVTWSLLSAGLTLAVVPSLVLVIPIWRYMVRGLLRGAVQ